MGNKFVILCLYALISCGDVPQSISNNTATAKMTIRKAFLYARKQQYDSLKLIMPATLFRNVGKNDFKINFREFKKLSDANEAVDTATFKIVTMPSQINPYLIIKLIPVNKGINIDSVKFTFVNDLGYEQIWSYEFFVNDSMFNNIKTQ
jgi:hypothetical protein